MGAAELFTARGFRNTSVKDVADRVEMTKGAVYFHYPTKEALAVAIVEEHYARWPKVLDEVTAEGFGPWTLPRGCWSVRPPRSRTT
ncbi:TetR/AcrR family transcriptional regulator [Streptomyces thinghirensis]|nr:TetR/AcrR family transcriptional regulator [Streptomyces thinghirensis]